MARPSQLEGRLLAVLDGVRDRRVPGRAAALGAAALVLALVLPLAAIRPGKAQQAVPAGVTFGGPKPWRDTTKTKPPRSSDAYPDLDAALRQGVVDVSIPAHPGERLTLELPDRVSARVEAWDRPSVHVRVDDTGLHVRAERGEGGPHVTVTGRPRTDGTTPHVRIQAPRNFSVHTEADGGGVEIGALNGTFTGTVTGGGLAFLGTRGTVRMTAHGGGAYVSDAHLDGRLEMDGGGVLMAGNSGNLDVTGAAATAHGRPGGRMRVDVAPGAVVVPGSGDEEVACIADACTIASTRATTTVGAPSGRASAIASGSNVAAASAAASPAAAVSSSAVTAGRVGGSAGWGATTVVEVQSGGSATTITAWDGATTRDRDGHAYLTGDAQGRIEALRAMARNAPPAAAAASLGRLAFTEDDARVQRAAVQELARLRTRAAVKQLGRIARGHPRSAIRAQAAAALR
jgi:hypothetical protein